MSKRKPLSDNPKPAVRAKLVAFAHYYRGHSDAKVRGNSKACYQLVSDRASDATAESMGSLYLNHPIVQEILQESAQRLIEEADINQAMVLQGIVKNIRRCEQAEPVRDRSGELVYVTTDQGEVAPAYKYDATNALRGYELLGKNLKMWTDKVDVSNPDGSLAHRDVPDEELDARISELERQVGRGQ